MMMLKTGSVTILPIKQTVTIGTKLNFNALTETETVRFGQSLIGLARRLDFMYFMYLYSRPIIEDTKKASCCPLIAHLTRVGQAGRVKRHLLISFQVLGLHLGTDLGPNAFTMHSNGTLPLDVLLESPICRSLWSVA